jgi:N-acetylglucosamine kinase-like BadF-type ATPase
MRCVLGIDGGGSKVACLAADETGRLLGYGPGGPVNTNYVLRQEAVESLKRAINTALEEAGLHGEQIEALCISAPMAPDAVEEAIKQFGIRQVIRAAEGETPRWLARFWIDEHIGVTVDAGTGSIARGWSRDGREAGAGGWGATLGDEGSGYWISMKAMIAILQACDGRIEETMLTKPVFEHFGMSDMLDMMFQVSQGLVRTRDAEFGVAPDSGSECSDTGEASVGGVLFHKRTRSEPLRRYEVATLCPVVAKVAQQGDWKAIEILKEAGYELARLGVAIIKRLGMESDEFAVVPFGGVFRAGELVLRSFRETILAAAPRAKVIQPRFEPVVGAVLLALSEIGVVIDDQVIAVIEQSSTRFPACRVRQSSVRSVLT